MANAGTSKQSPAFYVLIVCMIIMAIDPIISMLATSFKTADFNVLAVFFSPTIKNYGTGLCAVLWYEPASVDFCDPTFSRAQDNSTFIGLFSTAIALIVGCMAAYALIRFRFMGRGTVSMLTLLMRMVPPAVLLVPIVNSITEYAVDWGVIIATGMLLAIPPFIFTFIASKQIITGMTAFSVKG
mgnify:FL=1